MQIFIQYLSYAPPSMKDQSNIIIQDLRRIEKNIYWNIEKQRLLIVYF
ncbi:unnamed protein product [Paramecium octaurelia]|uniref:Uncharacterized protein n=1 Tax=Paramecium octaurelia TaxID=43137 RepID=A0A8S1WWU1_PAROT|nr:unnamed protein product [Paramecium octaurelia]